MGAAEVRGRRRDWGRPDTPCVVASRRACDTPPLPRTLPPPPPLCCQAFATSALVQPVIVNVGRAGAANLDVIQEARGDDLLAPLTFRGRALCLVAQ